MAANISNSFITQWSNEVHHLYNQKGSKLRKAVREVSGITGSTYEFHTMGSVVANTKARGANVTMLNPSQGTAIATLSDLYAPIPVDKLDESKTNASIREGYVKESANALGRATDNLIVTAMDADNVGIATTTGGLTYAKLLEALQALNEGEVDLEDRFLFLSPAAINDALLIPELTSGDYVQIQAVASGDVKQALGFNWIMSNRLTETAGVRDCYAFNKQAVGLAIGQDVKTAIDWIPEMVAHLVNSYMSMGATVIEAAGVVQVKVDEA